MAHLVGANDAGACGDKGIGLQNAQQLCILLLDVAAELLHSHMLGIEQALAKPVDTCIGA